jgi:hypothetical protein
MLPVFADQDTGRILARWDGGQLTLSRFLSEYGQVSPLKRVSVDTPESFRDQVDGIALEPYRARMARELGIDRDPLATSQIAKRLEQMQVEHLYQDSIEARVVTDPAEVRRYYDEHPAGFTTYPKARYAMFLTPNRAAADSLVAVLKGAPVQQVEAMVESAPQVNKRKGASIKEEKDQDHGRYHTMLFEEMKPGQSYVDGPDKDGVFAVIHSLEFDPGHLLPFSEARGYAEDNVRAKHAEEMLNRLLDRHRAGIPVTTHPELLARVRLMDPAATARNQP